MSSAPKVGRGERFYWDMAIVFAPHARWENVPPAPSFWRDPVYRVIPGLETALDKAVHQTP
ncbi:MAG TPA: hypothetical protein VGR72_13160 [Candidatus Acidoferrales bacterium]|nr:hypothetical protein [Candidatus Acidoferrales bacterium]